MLPVDVYDRSQTNKIASGVLSAVDTVVDPATGSVKLRAMFDNKDLMLFPSQFVNVRLLVNTLHNQTTVPVPAVQRGADGSYVFLVRPDKTVTQRAVKIGIQDGDKMQILSGLTPGDTVVVDGADRLRDGADIEIPAHPTPRSPRPRAAPGRSGARRTPRASCRKP